MKIRLAVITAALAFFSIGSVMAADQSESNQPTTASERTAPSPALGFGSGTNMGPGGGTGSATSLTGGLGSPVSGSGSGSQTFGGGFTGTSPLSTQPAAGSPLGPL